MNRLFCLLCIFFGLLHGCSQQQAMPLDGGEANYKDNLIKVSGRFYKKQNPEDEQFLLNAIGRLQEPEMAETLLSVCRRLFTVYYVNETHLKNKSLLEGCGEEFNNKAYGLVDRGAIPLVLVAPVTPEFAVKNKISGKTTVQFDVDEEGRLMNFEVIESTHRMFNRNSIDAAKKFIYMPAINNGVPVVDRGVTTKFEY